MSYISSLRAGIRRDLENEEADIAALRETIARDTQRLENAQARAGEIRTLLRRLADA
jgi:hypothetical protein